MNLLEKLVESGDVDKGEIPAIEQEVSASGETLENVMLKRGVAPVAILEAKGDTLNIPTRDISDVSIPFEVLNYIPEESAHHYQVVPLGVKEGVLEVGVLDPDNIDALDALNFISAKANLPFKVYLISQSDFDKVIKMYKGLTGEVTKALTDLETELSQAAAEDQKEERRLDLTDTKIIKEDAPATKMVATILRHAVEGDGSDVHIEPMKDSVRVRFRVDGVLYTSLVLPTKVHRALVARIKILSSIRLDEKRKPQDGRFSATVSQRKIDFRVSTFPTYYGEKVEMRILDPDKGVLTLKDLGANEHHIEVIRDAIKRPYGIILISGPTGSGKTTTLYAMLNEIDREKKNVLSLEDPVEYNIEGVSQSQVRPEIGYTFANGLRTTLRQDPDIIMVGEIRDKETAQLAIQAALTGHLVLSTIHTNNAIGVIPRLIDMGVDPYLIAPTLILTMAQRLVRKICPGTGREVPIEGARKVMLDKQFADLPDRFKEGLPPMEHFYEIEETKECPSGTKGRIAVFEMLPMDRGLEAVILEDPNDIEIRSAARKKGMITMKEDAIIKALDKIIPFEEINTLSTDWGYEEVPSTETERKEQEDHQEAGSIQREDDDSDEEVIP